MEWLSADQPGPEAARIGVLLVASGAVFVLAAKLFGFVFLRQRTPFRVGDPMTGALGEVTQWRGGEGFVMVDGESWRAVSPDALQPGDTVSVRTARGLTLDVSKSTRV